MRCPGCGSDDLRAAALVYEMETGVRSTSATGIGWGGGGIVVAGGAAQTRTMSALGARVAPPALPVVSSWRWFPLVFLSIPAFLLALTGNPDFQGRGFGWWALGIAVVSIGTTVLAYRATESLHQDHMAGYEANMAAWRRQWVCLRCGKLLERVAEPEPAPIEAPARAPPPRPIAAPRPALPPTIVPAFMQRLEGESEQAWARRIEAAEVEAFKARTKR